MLTWRAGRLPVFDFLTDDGGMFCDLPLSAFHTRGDIPLNQILPNIVPSKPIAHLEDVFWVGTYPALLGLKKQCCTIFGVVEATKPDWTYLFSIELDLNNDLYHFLESPEGFLAMVPNAHTMFRPSSNRPNWRRLPKDFSRP